MKKLNVLKLPLLMLLLVLLANCDGKIPDVPACKHLKQRLAKDPATGHLVLKASPTCWKEIGEVECGRCKWIMSEKIQFVGENPKTWLNGKPWSQLHDEAILLPAEESYAPLSSYAINTCAKVKCDAEVSKFKVKADWLLKKDE